MSFFKTAVLCMIVIAFQIDNGFATSVPNDPKTLPSCDDPSCYAVARPVPYPVSIEKDGVRVKYKYLSLNLPKDVDSLGITDSITVIGYDKNQRILIGSLSDDDFNLPESDISVADGLDIIFTKTPKDKAPEDNKNNFAWRLRILSKQELLGKADKIAVYKKEGLTVYFLSDPNGPYRNTAYIINPKIKNHVVIIQSNLDVEKFINIIASIKLKEK